jgi:hypothetical protein
MSKPAGNSEKPPNSSTRQSATRHLRRQIEGHGRCSFTFKPHKFRVSLAQSLSVADVHRMNLRPELEGLIVPSKIHGGADAGRPVILSGDQYGEVARISDTRDGGFSAYDDEVKARAKAFSQLAQQPQSTQRMGRSGRAHSDDYFDVECAIAKWQDICAHVGVPVPLVNLVSRRGRMIEVEREGA